MIFSVVFSIVFWFINMLLGILPNGGTIPQGFFDAIAKVWFFIRSYDFILPVTAFQICIPIAFGWILFTLIWGIIHWILPKIPFLNVK